MFSIAFLIGLYANCIMLLGMAHLLYSPVVLIFTGLYLFSSVLFWKKFDEALHLSGLFHEIHYHVRNNPLSIVIVSIASGLILIGALAPELAFDALWYHLTLPKLYLINHGLQFIPGGLLYYSPMPQLGEMLYTASLAIHSEVLAKLIHASFGLLICIGLYKVSRLFTDRRFAILSVVIFLSNIVVLWEATTAYIDLIRTFFELMSFWGIILYLRTSGRKWLVESAILMGLAIETKLIAITTLVVMLGILFFYDKRDAIRHKFIQCFQYFGLAMLIPLPWFVFSFLNTGNPFYPLFSGYEIHIGKDTLALPGMVLDPITIFFSAADPISPIYLMLLPLFLFVRKKITKDQTVIFVFAIICMLVWTLTPRTGGGRFLVPYLPVLSIASVILLSHSSKTLQKIAVAAVFLVSFTALAYRGIATVKYVPVVVGIQTKEDFLKRNLNFSFGDYYDLNGELARRVLPTQKVLLYGFHNLYYMDVQFIHESWVRKGDTFDFIATQNAKLPERFQYWQPVYTNITTGVTLYTVGHQWTY